MRTRHVVVLALVIAACGPRGVELASAPPVSSPVVTDDTSPLGRLDERAVPTAYELSLAIDPAAAGFSGEVAITVSVARPLRVLWLHGRDLVIDRATVTTADGATQPARVVADERTAHTEGQGELLGLGVDAPVTGRVVVRVAYHAPYREKEGLMRAGTKAKLVFTDLEPNDARALMPCFDDPRFKVPWTVKVRAPAGLGVYANYPEVRRTEPRGGWVEVEFQPTRPLPSYLIAIAVGELEVVPVQNDGVPIQLLLPSKHLAPYATVIRDATPRLLAELVRVFDEPVPFPKLDMLVIPMDPGRGGMENPGLTTLAAHMVLVDPQLKGDRARAQREDAVHVVAHELAHLWLGDLITIGDWGDLWLQEGSATWFGIRAARTHLGTAWIPPFNRDVIDARLKDGARPPIRMAIGKLEDANAMFRTETYAGGAAVFDALEAWLGDEVLTRAFADLIDRRRDGTTTLDDLVAALHARAPVRREDLADSLATMLDATRMPVVTATPACRSTTQDDVRITVDAPGALPVCFEPAGGARACAVVRGGAATVPLAATCPGWLLLNPGGGAPYTRTWSSGALTHVLAEAGLAGRDATAMFSELRARLIQTAFAGLSRDDGIAAAAWLASDRAASPTLVGAAVGYLDALERTAPDAAARKTVVAHVQQVLARTKRRPELSTLAGPATAAPLASWLARRGDPVARSLASSAVVDLGAAGAAGDEAVLARAATGTPAEFRALRTRLLASRRRQPTLLRALASFQFPNVARELLAVLRDRRLTPHDAAALVLAAIDNPALHAELPALVQARTDLHPGVVQQIERMRCDPQVSDHRCAAARAAWGVK